MDCYGRLVTIIEGGHHGHIRQERTAQGARHAIVPSVRCQRHKDSTHPGGEADGQAGEGCGAFGTRRDDAGYCHIRPVLAD